MNRTFRVERDGKRILQCHSRGDKRFSPFFCSVDAFGVLDSIEDHYQKSKVFREGDKLVRPEDWKQVKRFKKCGLSLHTFFVLPNGVEVPSQYHVFGWYSALWLKYLDAHPELVEVASAYDDYEDIFKHDFPLCQADCVRLYCKQGRGALLETCVEFFDWLQKRTVS